jgi:wyosine [tRNA(Phe)-imidazoG37] synthetase (radical SAM superfamily)
LNTILESLIKDIKKFTSIPVAVLTNATLLTRREVRAALQTADLVVPSLDAVTQNVFEKLNRPHPSLKVEAIIEGIKTFRQAFTGSLWLEVMLVKGINDSPAHIQKLKKVVAEIKPDKVQLNTVFRPPAEDFARPLNQIELGKIKTALAFPPMEIDIIAEFSKKASLASQANLEAGILSLVKRRPVTLEDMIAVLGKHRDELNKCLDSLMRHGKIKTVRHKSRQYYEPC